MRIPRCILYCMAALLASFAPAVAQTFPSRPITMIVGYSAGGNIDLTARAVATGMAKVLGQSIVIDNRAGAQGVIGQTAVARAEPDGYTLAVVGTTGFLLGPKLLAKPPYTLKDFVGIGSVTEVPIVIAVNSASKFTSFADFIAYAKANPGAIRIGHAGNGSTNHIAIVRLQKALGVQFTIVPYKGSAPAITDLLGNFIDAIADQVPGSINHINAGSFRPLAVTSLKRATDLPNVPTLDELGVKGVEIVTGSGILAPAKTPAPIVATLSDALMKALDDPDVQSQFRKLGADIAKRSAEQYGAVLSKDDAATNDLIKDGYFAEAK